ncbi:MAG: type II toxin-antitoxin system VapC family toxin [Planctomycetota bacterium]|nr:type II toxin-antitoxin system VapC family toxin [Planctomycetota bacterium]MDA1140958.1 type II toxin-antitoxin system VapC family toxin [Planctomycetota bacterium]
MARIYIETTIASFYHEVRTEPEMAARRNWTRRWFDAAKTGSDELVTSLAVEAELEVGNFPGKADALALIADLPLVDLNDSVAEAVDAYISHKVMPNDPTGDALHLAAASFHRCDFWVTWNCRHLANANKFGHIRRVNGILGLGNPALVTPLELLQEDTTDE